MIKSNQFKSFIEWNNQNEWMQNQMTLRKLIAQRAVTVRPSFIANRFVSEMAF